MTAVAHDALNPERIGVHRAVDPPGTLPHIARVLDAASPANPHEAEVDVQMLNVDATSFAEIRRRAGSDPARMADRIAAIVAERGKLQNPQTGSGGVLLGRVGRVGEHHHDPDLRPGAVVVPLASLIAIPLRLDEVGPVDPAVPQIPVRGRAIVTGRMPCGRVPADLPAALALTVFDVFPSATYARELSEPGDHVLVLGAGHAGLLALAALRAAHGEAVRTTVVDVSAGALERARTVDPGVRAVRADVTEPVGVAAAIDAPADLTLQCTSVGGAEGTALLATARRGTIVFFSTATRFAAAALGTESAGSQARLIIPNGYTDDRGADALELVRRLPALRAALTGSGAGESR